MPALALGYRVPDPAACPATHLALSALAGVLAAPPSKTHDLVTRLALAQSGRDKPYQRWEMLRDHRLHARRTAAGSLQPR